MVDDAQPKPAPVGLWSVVAIGIGGMVGGGIFAVLGLSVQIAKGGAPAAFLVAGLVALLTATVAFQAEPSVKPASNGVASNV
jgi:amino acid transporter